MSTVVDYMKGADSGATS